MKTYIDTSSITFDEVIIHSLPKHKKGDNEIVPRFSEKSNFPDFSLNNLLKDKIKLAIGSDIALKLIYDSENPSPISTIAKSIVRKGGSKQNPLFIEDSKKIARHLFDVQIGSNNEGILIIIPAKVNQNNALLLVKLEMDSGIQLVMNKETKSFDISSVEDLMMTKKTRVYKIALLLDKGLQGVKFDAIVTDNQIDMKAKTEVKSWFINKFLGCKPYKDPKIMTQHFYNYTRVYIDTLQDDIKRAKYHQDLNSYILKNSDFISPKDFADDYFQTSLEKDNYRNYLKEKDFGFGRFEKDASQVASKIKQMTIEFANGVIVTSKSGGIKDKVKLDKTEEGNTRATIVSRVRKFK